MGSKPAEVVLSDLQLAVMRELWNRGEATTADVAEALDAERGLAHTTIATLLTRLEKRGVVSSRRDGRQIAYRARVSESDVRRSMVSGLIASVFGGDAQALVTHLVRESEVEPGDLDRIRKLLGKETGHDA